MSVELRLRNFGVPPTGEKSSDTADRFLRWVGDFIFARSSAVTWACACACPSIGDSGFSNLLVNFDSLAARSSAWTSLLGGSSCFDSQPTGGLGGGLMKNNLPASGRSKYLVSLSTGVGSPK